MVGLSSGTRRIKDNEHIGQIKLSQINSRFFVLLAQCFLLFLFLHLPEESVILKKSLVA